MALPVRGEHTASRLGWWLGQAIRATIAALLVGGLLGVALGAARSVSVTEVIEDLGRGQVAEIVFTDSGAYAAPDLWADGQTDPVVRWKVVGRAGGPQSSVAPLSRPTTPTTPTTPIQAFSWAPGGTPR